MTQKEISHLYNRAYFGIQPKELYKLQKLPKSKVIDNLFEESRTTTPIALDLKDLEEFINIPYRELKAKYSKEELYKLRKEVVKRTRKVNLKWVDHMFYGKERLREKMTLFWANVFVCRDKHVFHIQQYNNMLRQNALGSFEVMAKAMYKEPSMVKYLNNKQNTKEKPNENFARELMELFTLGIGNYTEKDIKEAARAFTGYGIKKKGNYFFRAEMHDDGEKSFLGETGNLDGDDIIDIILKQKQCARYISGKILNYFLGDSYSEKILNDVTEVFYKDYNIENVMRYIFNSNWFYNNEFIGKKIKSPIELMGSINTYVPYKLEKRNQFMAFQKIMGQTLLYPDNVSGWKGGKNWINSNSLMFRMKLASVILNNSEIEQGYKGEFEDDFDKYYLNKKTQRVNTNINKPIVEERYNGISREELTRIVISGTLSKASAEVLNKKLTTNNAFGNCIQLMSLPEFQLC